MKMPDKSQVYAFGRHVVSGATGAIAYAQFLHLFQNPGDAQVATDAVSHIGNGLKEAFGGIMVLVPLSMGVLAALKASPLVQFALSAAAMLKHGSDTSKLPQADQKNIMEATGMLPKVNAVVTNDPVIAATTSPNIVNAADVKVVR